VTWTRHGECNGCGFCCESVSRDVLVRTEEQVAVDKPFYLARGFQPTTIDGERRYVLFAWLVAPCPELKKETWAYGTQYRCRIYEHRPETCQTFPRLPQDIVGTPCSYWFTHGEHTIGGQGSPHRSTVDDLVAIEEVTR
jgi:Fe-S-cluster containining protein